MAKKTKLSIEEQNIENEIAGGQWRFAKLTHKELAAIVKESKDSRINLRLSPTILDFYKRQADKERLPYQTLINQILEKFAISQGKSDIDKVNKRLDKIEELLQKLLNRA